MIPSWLPDYQAKVDSALHDFFLARYVGGSSSIEADYEAAIRYAVEWGGKRLRPILALIAYEHVSGRDSNCILQSVLGVEFIHCFTLVHDDLPCMDNDELRRGKPTVWKQYGETMAVLVWDTLQTMGFETLAQSGNAHVVQEIAHAIGDMWVTRWQVRDTMLRHDVLTLPELLRIHDEKTGWFIASCLVIGAQLASADQQTIETFRSFGFLLGRAFQIRDDILDYEGDSEVFGKKAGKDVALGKWIVALLGIEKSRQMLSDLEQQMMALLVQINNEKFNDIVRFVVHRKR